MPRTAARVTDAQTFDAIGRLVRDRDAEKAAPERAAVSPPPPPPPLGLHYDRDAAGPAGGTLYQATCRRVNDGLYAAFLGLCEYTHASGTAEYPCDIHEIDDRVNTVAEMIRAVRELFLVPGCREHLSGLPGDHDAHAEYRG